LIVVHVPFFQGFLEDRRVARHADNVLLVYETLQVAGYQAFAADVVEPDGNTLSGQIREWIGHGDLLNCR
jgi:hypothetical protein